MHVIVLTFYERFCSVFSYALFESPQCLSMMKFLGRCFDLGSKLQCHRFLQLQNQDRPCIMKQPDRAAPELLGYFLRGL